MKKLGRSIIVLVAVAAISQAGTISWNVGQDGTWTTGSKWVGGVAPVSGDSVDLGAGAGDDIQVNTTFAIQNGQSMVAGASFNELILMSASDLTLETGGTMDIGFMRPRFSSGGNFTIQAGASLDTDLYGLGSTTGNLKWIADASGVTTWNNSWTGASGFNIGLDTLAVDLTSYAVAGASSLTLVNYDNADVLVGTFGSITVTDGAATLTEGVDYTLDYTTDSNITLNVIPEPATFGLIATFGGGMVFLRRWMM